MKIENPWRKGHEAKSAVAWAAAGGVGLVIAPFASVPPMPVVVSSLISFGMSAKRAWATYRLWETQANLQGRGIEWIDPEEIIRLLDADPARLYLGKGFDWTPKHAQRLYELRRREVDEILPPAWYLHFRKRWSPHPTGTDARGEEWIHGLEPNEETVRVPFSDLEGNTVIFGTTGSGKTRLFEILCTQIIHRKRPPAADGRERKTLLVALDPKGDIAWRERLQLECERAGKEFIHFHPAHPSLSVRLDPLKNWQRVTELASRVASLIRGDSGDSVFKDFAWRAIQQITEALVVLEERPNLLKLRRYIEGGPEHLLSQTLQHFFQTRVPGWEDRLEPYLKRANKGEFSKEQKGREASNQLMAMVRFYKSDIPESMRASHVDGLLSMFEHNRDHHQKLIQSLLPLLTQLTSGDIGALLSPDGSDPNDMRPILDTKKIIEAGQVLYIGLDALSDASVASAIGAIVLSDLASVAGHRYNYGDPDGTEIFLVVDEATECMTPPFVQLLNKGRGAGFRVFFASQSFPDFVARTGNKPLAQMLVANANNLIALRTIEAETQEYIVGNFGKTTVQSVVLSQSANASSDVTPGHYSGGVSERISESEVDIFPSDMLGKLPDLHYVANFTGRLVKGRLQLMTRERTPTLQEMPWLQT